jgi:hypothetical protein
VAANELVIKINGDVKNYQDALEKAQEKTAALEDSLKKVATVSGVAFAGLTASIYLNVKAFAEADAANQKLTLALQNQGIYSDELKQNYDAQANALLELTGIDDDATKASLALLQSFLGQIPIADKLTMAIADLAAAQGIDFASATEIVGRAIQGNVMALNKMGVEIDDNISKQQRIEQVIERVGQKFGGQAQAINGNLAGLQLLKIRFGDVSEAIGERLLPIVDSLARIMASFFNAIAQNKALADLLVSLITAGTVITGLAVGVSTGAIAFLKIKAAMEAAGIATEAMTLATRGLVAATGLGLIVTLGTAIFLNWSSIWPRMQAIYSAFAQNVSSLTSGLGQVLKGAFSFDLGSLRAGLAQMKETLAKGYADATKDLKPISLGGAQDDDKAEAAEKAAAREIEIETNKQEALEAQRQLTLMKLGQFSTQSIALKQQEIETLKQLETEKNQEIKDALYAHLDEIREAQEQADEQSQIQADQFAQNILAKSREFNNLSTQEKTLFAQQSQDKLRQQLESEKSIRFTYAQQQLEEDIKRRNQFLLDEQKFGTSYALINKTMHESVFTGSKNAFNELTQLQNSKNAELKAIGKAAAVASIAIRTAESAMNIFAGFSTIPFIGQALGLAGAAAAIAYGVEQTGNVLAAADGGIITGGIPNIDSVPAMLMPGELVVPKRNFEETVSAVASQRTGLSSGDEDGSSGGIAEIVLTLKDDLVDFVEARLIERQRLNISLQGAV